MNELAVVLEQRRDCHARLLGEPRDVHAERQRQRHVGVLRRVELPQPDAEGPLRAAKKLREVRSIDWPTAQAGEEMIVRLGMEGTPAVLQDLPQRPREFYEACLREGLGAYSAEQVT